MALMLYIIFLLFAIFGRVVIQYKLTGDSGIRLFSKKTSFITILSSLLFFITFISSFILSLFHALGKIETQFNPGLFITLVGIFFCSVGILITVISQYQMGVAWRIGVNEDEQTELVTNGLYSLVRNPIFSGVFLFGIGLLVIVPHVYMLVSILIGYISIELQVRYTEEPYLIQRHGKKYKNYMTTTNRYIPNVVKILTKSIVIGD